MLSGYDAERLASIEEEDALADEFCEWVRSWQTVPAEGSTPERVLSGARLEGLLGMGRIRIISVMNNRLRGERGWRQANQLVRQAWLAKRERWLLMGLPELEWEEEERKRREKAAARGAEAEVHDDDAPYAVAGDVGVQPASGVSGDSISDESSSPGVTGSPQEEGVQPDAEQPDEDGVDAPVNAPAEDVDAEDEEGVTSGLRLPARTLRRWSRSLTCATRRRRSVSRSAAGCQIPSLRARLRRQRVCDGLHGGDMPMFT